MMRAIEHFGCDAHYLVVQDNFAMGYQSLWTVPEEQGERQPLFDQASDTWMMFYGRIDNRNQLLRELSLNNQAQSLSDAALLHAYLLRFGESKLAKVVGPFVFVLFNQGTGVVTAARDAMGGRHLVFRVTSDHIHIASYELALVAHSSVDYQFDQARLARWIANLMEDQLTSTIKGLTPLNPGELVNIGSSPEQKLNRKTFYRHDARKRVQLANDQEYAAEFRRLLTQAVTRRMRSLGSLGSMLSGGFDSVPITILMSELATSQEVTALSWVHDRYPEADERHYSTDVCQRFGIEQVFINCDDVWPTLDSNDGVETHLDPVLPISIPYTQYHQVALREAQQRNIKVVMTGIHGDLLYGHSESVFKELFLSLRWRRLYSEARRYWQTAPSRWQVVKHFVIKQIPGMQKLIEWRRLSRPVQSDCLQKPLLQQLSNTPHPLFKESLKALRPQHYRVVFDGFAGEDMAMGRHMEAKFQLERRYPFRDRDLCEFMASVPSDQLYFDFTPRPIVRNAFKHQLSDSMLARRSKTEFSSVISDGIRRDASWQPWFYAESASWQQFVKQCYFERQSLHQHSVELVKWRCAYYDYWKSVCYTHTCNELGIDNDC